MVGIYLKMSPEDLAVLEEVTCPVHGEPEVLGKYIGLTASGDNGGERDFRRPSRACVCVLYLFFGFEIRCFSGVLAFATVLWTLRISSRAFRFESARRIVNFEFRWRWFVQLHGCFVD